MDLEESEDKTYNVELDDAAARDFNKLRAKAKDQVAKLIDSLEVNPYIGNVRQLSRYKGLYRKRTGDYRVIYKIDDDVLEVIVVAVGPRKDVYEILKRRIS